MIIIHVITIIELWEWCCYEFFSYIWHRIGCATQFDYGWQGLESHQPMSMTGKHGGKQNKQSGYILHGKYSSVL